MDTLALGNSGLYRKSGASDAIASTQEPTNKINGLLWFELGSFFPQPWTWESANNLWMSNTILFDFSTIGFTATTNDATTAFNRPVPFYGVTPNRSRIEHIFGLYNTEASPAAHNTNNYFNVNLKYFRGSDSTPQQLFLLPENTQGMTLTGGSRFRRVTQSPDIWLPGNTWFIQQEIQKKVASGATAASISVSTNLMMYMRFARP